MPAERYQRIEPVEACQRLLVACGDRSPSISPEQMAALLPDWKFYDCDSAVVMQRGPEIHVAAPSNARGRWLNRRHIREFLSGTLRIFGRVITSVKDDNAAGIAFVTRLGFERISESNGSIFFQMNEVKHA